MDILKFRKPVDGAGALVGNLQPGDLVACVDDVANIFGTVAIVYETVGDGGNSILIVIVEYPVRQFSIGNAFCAELLDRFGGIFVIDTPDKKGHDK
jgi:hypothetical protein